MSILFLRYKENYNYNRLHIKTINYIHMISRQLGPYIYMMSRKLHLMECHDNYIQMMPRKFSPYDMLRH